MRGVIILTVISLSLFIVSAKSDGGEVEKVEDKGVEASESNIRQTAVFVPQRLKNERSSALHQQDKKSSEDNSDQGGEEISTSQTQHSAIVRVQEIHDDGGHQNSDEHVPQAYKFGYEVKDQHHGHQFRHEQKDPHGTIHGRFGYRDKEGQYRQVDYVADDYGFRANVKTNEFGVENQNPANVDIEKHQEDMHHASLPPTALQSKDVKHDSHTELHHKSEEEDDVVPHTGSSAHSDSSHEQDYDEDSSYEDQPPRKDYHHGSEENHEEPPTQKVYHRVSETGHHPITLRPREKYAYQHQREMQPVYHPSYQGDERHTKVSGGRRPLYREGYRPEPDHHSSQKKEDYHLVSKGKSPVAIVSRHFYKKHLTHHQHIIQHPPPKFKKDSRESPKSIQYQQLSRGLSARMVPSRPMKHQQHPHGDASYDDSGEDALHMGPHRETYRDAPQHYVQTDHPDSHGKQHNGEYAHQIEYLPQKDYRARHNEGSGEQYSSEEGVHYNNERGKDLHGYANGGHGNNNNNQVQSQEYIHQQNTPHYEPHPSYHGPGDKEHQTNQQHSNDLPVNKVQHVVFKVPLFTYGHQGQQAVQSDGNGKEHGVYVHPAQQIGQARGYAEHKSANIQQSPPNGEKVHFPEGQHHSRYMNAKTTYVPNQYQEAHGIADGRDAHVHHHQAAEIVNHHQNSPSFQNNYQNVPQQEYHPNENTAVQNAHNLEHARNGQGVQYYQENKQQPDYGNYKEYSQKVAYNGHNVLKHQPASSPPYNGGHVLKHQPVSVSVYNEGNVLNHQTVDVSAYNGDNVLKHQPIHVSAVHHQQSYGGLSDSHGSPPVLHQGEIQQVHHQGEVQQVHHQEDVQQVHHQGDVQQHHHERQVQQVPVEYQQTVQLHPDVYNQLVNTASLSPQKVVAIPVLKHQENGNPQKLFLVGSSHSVAPDNGQQHQEYQKVVEEVPVLVPSGQKYHSLYEGGNNNNEKLILPQNHGKSDAFAYSQQVPHDSSAQHYNHGKIAPRRSSRGGTKKILFFSAHNGPIAKKPDSGNLYQIQIDSAEQSSLNSAGQTLYDQYKSVSGSLGKEEPRVNTASKSKWIPIPGPRHRSKLRGSRTQNGFAHPSSPLHPTGTHYNNKYGHHVPDHASNYGSPINLNQYEAEQGLHGQIRYAPSNKIVFKKSCNCKVKNGKIIRRT